MNAFLNIPDFYSFMRGLLIMAIIPALGEEMFFRGVLMRFVKKRSRTMLAPILTSAALFALAHSNVYGLPSIFSAGILLAVIYYLTGSLWCSIFAHLLFNGLQVILSYAGSNNAAIKAFMSTNTVSYPLVIGSILVFCVSFYLLWKNRTPLAPNWTDDFAPGELPGFDFGEKNK
jgi:membrane protease YdiL (CAAX protease family)